MPVYYNIHTHHSRFIPEGVAKTSQILLRDTHILPELLATKNTVEVTGGKPVAIQLQSISGVLTPVNHLVAFYDIRGRKGEVLFFCSISDTTRDKVTKRI
jgi:hypothetical protein